MPNTIIDLTRAVDEKLLIERLFTVRADTLEENDRRTVDIIAATEYEARQWFGREVIQIDTDSVDLSRLQAMTAPLMLDHSRDGLKQIGVVESARIVNRQLIATVRFSRNPLGDQMYKDVIDGIRCQFGSGYRIFKWEVDETDPSDPLYTIPSWQPYELSLVTVNADPNSLVKRGYFTPDENESTRLPAGEPTQRGKEMEKENEGTQQNGEGTPEPTEAQRSGAEVVNVASFEIYERGKAENEQALALQIIGERGTLEDFEKALREKREAMQAEATRANSQDEIEAAERNRYNISDLIFQQLNPGADRGKDALQEAQDLTADAERSGYVRQGGGYLIPHSRLDGIDEAQRDLTTAANSGGTLVGTDVRGDLFIDALRNRMVMGDLVMMVTDLRGNASLPKETTAATAAWLGENEVATESNPVIGQVPLVPRFVRGFTEVSRTLIAQGSVDVEMVVRNSLMKGVALVVDKAILTGTGQGNQPGGVDSISGLNTVEYGAVADDLPTALAKATIENLTAVENHLDENNVMEMDRAWVVAPNIRQHFRTVPIATGGIPAWYMGRLLDEMAYVTNQAPSGTAYFGAWKDIYCGMWGGIEILVNPFSGDTAGRIRITAWQMADIGIGHEESVAKLIKKA